MAINSSAAYILNRFDFSISERLVEYYYRKKLHQPCFLMNQHGRWTIVTVEL